MHFFISIPNKNQVILCFQLAVTHKTDSAVEYNLNVCQMSRTAIIIITDAVSQLPASKIGLNSNSYCLCCKMPNFVKTKVSNL